MHACALSLGGFTPDKGCESDRFGLFVKQVQGGNRGGTDTAGESFADANDARMAPLARGTNWPEAGRAHNETQWCGPATVSKNSRCAPEEPCSRTCALRVRGCCAN